MKLLLAELLYVRYFEATCWSGAQPRIGKMEKENRGGLNRQNNIQAPPTGQPSNTVLRGCFAVLFLWRAEYSIIINITLYSMSLSVSVCSGGVVVTAYDFESGRWGSNLEWDQHTIRLRSLHRAYPSLHPFGVVHWYQSSCTSWLMVAA